MSRCVNQLCVAQPSPLNRISSLSDMCRAVRSGLNRTPAPLPCSLALLFIFLSVGPAASLPRSKSARLCYSRLANTTRSGPSLESCRLPSTSLGSGECGGYLLVLATVLRCRALHIIVDAKSRIYILLLNIFSPRVTRVTRIYL